MNSILASFAGDRILWEADVLICWVYLTYSYTPS